MLTTTLRIDAHGIPNRFKVWELYFTIRSSKQFIQNWVTFLSLMKVSPTPVLYQHLTAADAGFRRGGGGGGGGARLWAGPQILTARGYGGAL